MKRSLFQAAIVSILWYRCTTWTLTKRLEKKLDGNYTRMLRAILNKSWRQHPTKQQLYGHLLPIMKTIQVRRTRHAGHCWRSRDELISDVLLWTPSHDRAKPERPARTYIQQLCEDTGCSPEDLPEAMNDREEWRERGSGISVLMARQDDDDADTSEKSSNYSQHLRARSDRLSSMTAFNIATKDCVSNRFARVRPRTGSLSLIVWPSAEFIYLQNSLLVGTGKFYSLSNPAMLSLLILGFVSANGEKFRYLTTLMTLCYFNRDFRFD